MLGGAGAEGGRNEQTTRLARTGGERRREYPLSEEAAVTLTVNGREVVTLLCSPRDLREMAVGWLFAEGIIRSSADLVALAGCARDRELLVTVAGDLPTTAGHWRLVTSGCGAGGSEGLRPERVPRVASGATFPLARLREQARAMLAGAVQYRRTGGIHSAALVSPRGLVIREDIGRHNAVDKVIGYGLLAGEDFTACALLSTGRLSSEMAWKAAVAGVPLVASLSIPSNLARDIAEAAGITLVGRVLSARPWVYTHPERIADPDG